MALIKCEECGQMVSDKAAACPHCGCPMQSQNESVDSCPECGHSVPKTASICPNCGYPVEKMSGSSEEAYQEMYRYDFDPDEEPSHSKHRIIWAIVALLVPLALFGIYWLSELGYFDSSSNTELVDDSPAIEQVLPDSVSVEGVDTSVVNSDQGDDFTSESQVNSSQNRADIEIRNWLRGEWVRTDIDPTTIELVAYVWTFTNEGYNFTYGSERTYNPSSKYYSYEVKDDIIYSSGDKPILIIDKSHNCLIDYDNNEEVYKKQ